MIGCPVWQVFQEAEDNNAEIMVMVLDDEEGYSSVYAADVIRRLTNDERLKAADVRSHRSGECPCGGVLVRTNEG